MVLDERFVAVLDKGAEPDGGEEVAELVMLDGSFVLSAAEVEAVDRLAVLGIGVAVVAVEVEVVVTVDLVGAEGAAVKPADALPLATAGLAEAALGTAATSTPASMVSTVPADSDRRALGRPEGVRPRPPNGLVKSNPPDRRPVLRTTGP